MADGQKEEIECRCAREHSSNYKPYNNVLYTVARGPGGVRRHWGITVKDTPGAAGALCDARGAPHFGTAASW